MFDKDKFIRDYRESIMLEEDRDREWEKEYKKFIFCLAETAKYPNNSVYVKKQEELVVDFIAFMRKTGYKYNIQLDYDLNNNRKSSKFEIKQLSFWDISPPTLWFKTKLFKWPHRSPKYNLGEIPLADDLL